MIVPKPGQVSIGEERKSARIDHSYAIAATEVTVEEFLRFRKDHKSEFPARNGPVDTVSWHDAAAYCNWLSKEEGMAEDQWCYEPEHKRARPWLQPSGRPGD